MKSPTSKLKSPHFSQIKKCLPKKTKKFIYKISSAYNVKKLAVIEKEMLEDPTFQRQENERKAAHKAERNEKKKEDLREKTHGGFARRRFKTSTLNGTRIK